MPIYTSGKREEKEYTSKTKRNECKNEKCTNKRANGSSRCEKCKLTNA